MARATRRASSDMLHAMSALSGSRRAAHVRRTLKRRSRSAMMPDPHSQTKRTAASSSPGSEGLGPAEGQLRLLDRSLVRLSKDQLSVQQVTALTIHGVGLDTKAREERERRSLLGARGVMLAGRVVAGAGPAVHLDVASVLVVASVAIAAILAVIAAAKGVRARIAAATRAVKPAVDDAVRGALPAELALELLDSRGSLIGARLQVALALRRRA
eukprot:2274174-Prymnesium_polylepis.2